jgi:SWI/SNF-related matrix-associated actin-dependent regulator 1 of chromatin subfamily A
MANLTYRNGVFVWLGGYETRATPKAAGLLWHGGPCRPSCKACAAGLGKAWWTLYPEKASKLEAYADDAAKTAFASVVETVAASHATTADIQVPAPEGRLYFGYQLAGIAFLLSHLRTLLGDEMGVGKTIQVIGTINADTNIRTVLLVCPASLRTNWRRELSRWLTREADITVLESDSVPAATEGRLQVLVTSYERARKLYDALSARTYDLFVADEAHFVKNAKSRRTKAVLGYWDKTAKAQVKGLADCAKRAAFLTGTPLPNRPIELWPLLRSLDPQGLGRNWESFVKRYCAGHQEYMRAAGRMVWVTDGASNLEELQQRLRSSCMIRRLKSEVLKDLPAKIRQIVPLAPNGAAAAIRREAEAFDKLAAKYGSPAKVPFTEMSAERHAAAIAKAGPASEIVVDALEGGLPKLVVFSYHHDVTDKVVDAIREAGYGVLRADGRDSTEARDASVQAFQTDASVNVLVCGISAMGVGHTMTAASTAIFIEQDWTPGNIQQAEDRLHRIGQQASVPCLHVVFEGSLDERMIQLLAEKSAVQYAALDAAPAPLPEVPAPATGGNGSARRPARTWTDAQRTIAAQVVRMLAGMCDGAATLDGAGFAKVDVARGHALAARTDQLSDSDVEVIAHYAAKYHRQLPTGMVEALK